MHLPDAGDGSRAPRVLLATDFLVRYTAALTRGLADSGAATKLLTRTHDREFGDRPGAMRAFVEQVLGGAGEPLMLPGRASQVSTAPALARTWSEVRRFRPDVVHLQDTIRNDPRLIVAAGVLPGRYALTIHDPIPRVKAPRTRFRVARRALLRGAGLIFVHAESLRDELIESERPSSPIVVVPHGVDTPRRRPLPRRPSLLFFGRIHPYKGLDTLLDAMPAVWERLPEAALTVAGKGELPDHPVLEDSRVVVRQGHIPEPDVPELYAESTCVVLPYREASQSGVGSLAKQYGRAMVATAVGGLPELVTPDVGRVVAPANPPALAEAMLEVLTEERLAEAMGEAAAASAVDEVGWKRVGELTLEAYGDHLLGRGGRTWRRGRRP